MSRTNGQHTDKPPIQKLVADKNVLLEVFGVVRANQKLSSLPVNSITNGESFGKRSQFQKMLFENDKRISIFEIKIDRCGTWLSIVKTVVTLG